MTKLVWRLVRRLALYCLAHLPLEELGEVFNVLTERVYAHRQDNRGFVPREIFAACVGLGGVYPCVELVVDVLDGQRNHTGYALKKRGGAEQGWEGEYQIVGCAGRITDGPNAIMARLTKEIWGEFQSFLRLGELEFVGTEIHAEPERRATCWTLVWSIGPMCSSKISWISMATGGSSCLMRPTTPPSLAITGGPWIGSVLGGATR